MATTRPATQKIIKSRKTTKSKSKAKPKLSLNQSAVYILASTLFVGTLIVSATIFFFGWKIMRTLDEIQYPYNPDAPLSIGSLIYYGRQEGLDSNWFKSCIQSEKYEEDISNDLNAASTARIDGTPGFYIGEYLNDSTMRGFIIPGNFPYATFSRAIELVNENGVDAAFEELTDEMKDSIYSSRYDSYVSYYEQTMSTAEAEKKADDSAASYTNDKWQIREVGLGSIEPKKSGNPKVVIVEFTDFECPVCRSFTAVTFDQLDTNYIEPGTVAFYIRNFPIEQLHDNAMTAAKAAMCANEKGKFWDLEPWLFGTEV